MTTTEVCSLIASLDFDPEIKQRVIEALRHPRHRRTLISRKEVMKRLGLSAPTLRKLIRAGNIHVYALSPRKTRFDLEEVEALASGDMS